MRDDAAAAHCARLVRDQARPRYVAALFAPEPARRKLFALYAIDIELRRIPDAAREEMIQAMRFQWWRDALAALPATRGHPVLAELAHAGEGEALQALVDAHERRSEPVAAEAVVVRAAARMCGGSGGGNDVADFAAAAIVTHERPVLAEARRRWRAVRGVCRNELPAYLPATIADMRHPVGELGLYWRMLVMGLRNRF